MNKLIALGLAIVAPLLSTLSWCGGHPGTEATKPVSETTGQSQDPLDEIRHREGAANQRIREAQARVLQILKETMPPSTSSTH